MQIKKEYVIRSLIIAIIIAVFLVGGFIVYNNNLTTKLSETTCDTLEEIMLQQSYNFTSKITDELSAMQAMATMYSYIDLPKEELIFLLNSLMEQTPFDAISYTDINGNALSSTGKDFSVADRNYFKKSIEQGVPVISEPLTSRVDKHKSVILVCAPVIKNGKINGALIGSYSSDELKKLFLPSFNGMGYAFIANNEGQIISETKNSYTIQSTDNLFHEWQNADFYSGDSFETMRQNLYINKGGHSQYEIDGQKRLMHYSTIAVNDWNIFTIVPADVISKNASEISFTAILMTFGVILVFAGLLIYIYKIQKSNINKISHIAFVDELTGAPTLAKFKLDAQRLMEENPDTKYLIIKNDIDRFKLINQQLGFEVGDKVLINAAKAMEKSMYGDKEAFGKANVDEFVLLHEYISEKHLFERRQVFTDTFRELMGKDFNYNVNFPSGHYYIITQDAHDISSALEKANIAHRKAKSTGVEVCIYDEAMISEALKQKDIENRMEQALLNGEFKVFLQPKYFLNGETVAGAEALVRWKDGENSYIYPGTFIPLFEQNGFITKLDMYMFEKVCSIIHEWQISGITPAVISVNFSRLHLNNSRFVEDLCAIAKKYTVPADLLEIELTETTIFDNEDSLLKVLGKLHSEGFTLSMDDFGTGYSSLGLLKNIPVDVIKMDRSFFVNSSDLKRSKTVLLNVVKMARELGIHTVAEGVETKEHIDLLRELGCDIVQGYYYAKPMPHELFVSQSKLKDIDN